MNTDTKTLLADTPPVDVSKKTAWATMIASGMEQSGDLSDAETGTESLMDGTKFLVNLVTAGQHLYMGEDAFFFCVDWLDSPAKAVTIFLEEIFSQGFYIEDISYANLESVYRGEAGAVSSEWRVRIGKTLARWDEGEKESLEAGYINSGTEIFFECAPNRLAPRDIDRLASFLFSKGVRIGFSTEGLVASVRGTKTDVVRYSVAKSIDPTPSRDAEIKPLVQISRSRKIVSDSEDGQANLRIYECSFPEVPKEGEGTKYLVKKIPAFPGANGFKLDGSPIAPKPPKDVDLAKLAGDGIMIVELDGITYLATDRQGFITTDRMTKKLSITDEVQNTEVVGAATGSILVDSPRFNQMADVEKDYSVFCQSVKMPQGILSWSLVASVWDVEFHMISEGGSARSVTGNVVCTGKVLSGRVEAISGKITVPYAENSVLFGKEIVVEKAVNCVLIADTLQVGTNCGSHFFAKDATIGIMDSTPPFNSYTMGMIYIHDNLHARKILKTFRAYGEKVSGNIASLERKMSEHGLAIKNARGDVIGKQLVAKQTAGEILNPREQEVLGKIKAAYGTYNHYKGQLAKQQELFGTLWQETENADALLQALDRQLADSIRLSIGSIRHDAQSLEEYRGWRKQTGEAIAKGEEPTMAPVGQFGLRFYTAHDLPACVAELAEYPREDQQYFAYYVTRLILGEIRNDARLTVYRSEKFYSSPMSLDYAEMRSYIDAFRKKEQSVNDETSELGVNQRGEMRLTMIDEAFIHALRSQPEIANQRLNVPVVIDKYFTAYMQDMSATGVCMLLDMNQKYPPIFERLEEIEMEFRVGTTVYRHSLVLTGITELPNRMIRLWGYFVWLTESEEDELYLLRNALEVQLRTEAAKRR